MNDPQEKKRKLSLEIFNSTKLKCNYKFAAFSSKVIPS